MHADEPARRRPKSLLDCDGPYALSAMPVQAMAVTSGRCHLERDHHLDVGDFGGKPGALMDAHFTAHGFVPIPTYPVDALPWRIRDLPHEMLRAIDARSDV
jgi:hypothetical protein